MQNIIFIGLISFFTDISTEMIYPIIPLYLASQFGASPALVGVIEGIAESLASLLRVFSGHLSDKFKKKKALAFIGYSTGIFYKAALIFATSWLGILAARATDRIGKGIRTAPRDVLVSESVDKSKMGRAFGLHKSLDMAGSAIGILITYFLLGGIPTGFEYRKLFIISIVPAFLGLFMFLFVKEKPGSKSASKRGAPFRENIKKLDARLKLYLLVVLLFNLGNSSNAFLLLKSKGVGFEDRAVILLYFIYTVTASVLSLPFGRLSDKIGRKSVLITGYFVFAIVYVGFAFAMSKAMIVCAFILYGAHTAMIAGVERAFVAEIAPKELKGTMLGLHSTIAGLALLPASIITGVLWNIFGPAVPFVFGACLSAAAAALLLMFWDRSEEPAAL